MDNWTYSGKPQKKEKKKKNKKMVTWSLTDCMVKRLLTVFAISRFSDVSKLKFLELGKLIFLLLSAIQRTDFQAVQALLRLFFFLTVVVILLQG